MKERRANLQNSFFDGVFFALMTGFTQDFFVPFLLNMGGGTRHAGLIFAIPNLAASILQVKGADLVEKLKSRKLAITIFVSLQCVTLALIAYFSFTPGVSIWVFIVTVTVFTGFGSLSLPPLGSLVTEFVPKRRWGKYFGWRNRIMGLITVGAAFLAGYILKLCKPIELILGFFIIFVSALLFRLISLFFLVKLKEPPFHAEKEHYFSFKDFLKTGGNFKKFVFFTASMSFSIHMAAPYFAVLMIRDFNFSYLLYTAIISTGNLAIFFMTKRWGQVADSVGNVKIMKLTSRLIAFVPLFWIFNHNPVFLFAVQLFAGTLYGGYLLATTNYVYDLSSSQNRSRSIAYFNAFNGISICAGALLSSFLVNYLPPVFGFKILTLLLLSSLMRITVTFFIPFKIEEVRAVKNVNSFKLFFCILSGKKT
ncbi:MAG: MFS transporter [Nitrospirae bacterium YQR-1]